MNRLDKAALILAVVTSVVAVTVIAAASDTQAADCNLPETGSVILIARQDGKPVRCMMIGTQVQINSSEAWWAHGNSMISVPRHLTTVIYVKNHGWESALKQLGLSQRTCDAIQSRKYDIAADAWK